MCMARSRLLCLVTQRDQQPSSRTRRPNTTRLSPPSATASVPLSLSQHRRTSSQIHASRARKPENEAKVCCPCASNARAKPSLLPSPPSSNTALGPSGSPYRMCGTRSAPLPQPAALATFKSAR